MKTHTTKKTPYWIIITVQSVVTVFFILYAIVSKQEANQQRELAQINERKVKELEKIALHEKEIAELEKRKADEQKMIAEDERRIAELQKKIAEEQTKRAEEQTKRAIEATRRARK
jgi:uncharacterized protein HemX